MIFSLIFIFLIVVGCCGILYFFFGFFVPAIKLRYDGVDNLLSTEEHLNDDSLDSSTLIFENAAKKGSPKSFAIINSVERNDESLVRRIKYNGEKSCLLFHTAYGSEYKDSNCCIGFGDCQKVCSQEAIIIENGIAKITTSCNGCGKCLEVCPNNLISIQSTKPTISKRDFKFWNTCYKMFFGKRV